MRALHATGGKTWVWRENEAEGQGRCEVVSEEGAKAHCLLRGNWKWQDDPQWYQDFHYTEEVERGYPADENLYSAGTLEIQLNAGESAEWMIAQDALDLIPAEERPKKNKSKAQDFVLTQPAGIVAGYPWFGEWGRDTFVSLPGIAIESVRSGEDPNQVWSWVQEVLHRWGDWIDRSGMLPNIVEKNGKCQWQSADATLWWCHSLAVLWAFSLSPPFPFAGIEREFLGLLGRAIESIQSGRHRFLQRTPENLLSVTEPHTTWMDAKVNGIPVTPRLGCLPEINALWFEACCLHSLWTKTNDSVELENLGKRALQIREQERPNSIFLHSLPLAPSFVLKDWDALERDLFEIAGVFWTPVGLRTLPPSHAGFRAHCIGTQEQRDRAYHQGTSWGWLGGHFEMARHRLNSHPDGSGRAKEVGYQERFDHSRFDKMFTAAILKDMPIEGHIPEIFDAEPPFTPRGAPAQAWSLACVEESKARRRLRTDSKISKILAQRWLGRKERQVRMKRPDGEAGVIS
jgi:4-alpha-glucanotransferase